jgi:hypothetical protein
MSEQETEVVAISFQMYVEAFPWIENLPSRDQVLCVEELSRSARVDSFEDLRTVIDKWKNTAGVWADPELLDDLNQPIEDGGIIPNPEAGNE